MILCCMLAATIAVAAPVDTTRMVVVARIGESEGAVFGQIEAVEIADDGSVFVLDGYDTRVRAFSSEGAEKWSLGREGEGPGEFASPVGLTWAPDGALWVIDPENQRATAVDATGAMTGSFTITSGFTLSPWPGRFDRQGRLHHYVDVAGESYGYAIAVYDGGLNRVDLAVPPAPPEKERFFEGRTERGSHMRARVPFTPRFTWRLDSRGRFVSNWSAELRFNGPFGSTEIVEGSSGMGPRVDDAARREAIASLAGFTRRGGRIDVDRIPTRRPPVATFVLDGADRIWALRTGGARAARSVFEVFGADGRHAGTVALDARISTHPTPVVRHGWFVGVEVDRFGEQAVVLARVPDSLR